MCQAIVLPQSNKSWSAYQIVQNALKPQCSAAETYNNQQPASRQRICFVAGDTVSTISSTYRRLVQSEAIRILHRKLGRPGPSKQPCLIDINVKTLTTSWKRHQSKAARTQNEAEQKYDRKVSHSGDSPSWCWAQSC